MCPPSFIEIASKEDGNLTNLYYKPLLQVQTQDPIPLLGEWDNNSEDETTHKQNPIPLLGEWDDNSEDETTQKQDPIPLLGEWDN